MSALLLILLGYYAARAFLAVVRDERERRGYNRVMRDPLAAFAPEGALGWHRAIWWSRLLRLPVVGRSLSRLKWALRTKAAR